MAGVLRGVLRVNGSARLLARSFAARPKTTVAGSVPAASQEQERKPQTVYHPGEHSALLSRISDIPPKLLASRTVRIAIPARTVTQNGDFNDHLWQMNWDTQERWENPLMGWSSSSDPLSNLAVSFDSKEAAIAFAEKNGWSYYIEEPRLKKMRPKSYGANFSWDKRTRKGCK